MLNSVTPLARRLGAYLSQVSRFTSHDRHWQKHPAVRTADELTFGERAADHMKAVFSTWTALLTILLAMTGWIITGAFGHDEPPFILLNLCLSCLAALQCFILLIAAKRADQIAAAIALHTLDNTQDVKTLIEQNTAITQDIKTLIEQNTDLTQQVATLTQAVHDLLTTTGSIPQQPPTTTTERQKTRHVRHIYDAHNPGTSSSDTLEDQGPAQAAQNE